MDCEKILIVDDEKNILDLSCLYLEREGFSTLTAQDGLRAYEKSSKNIPDFVVLDVMLPGIDGFDLCKRLGAEGNAVPTPDWLSKKQPTIGVSCRMDQYAIEY